MEQTYFDDGRVRVTNTRFIVGAQTYAVRNITSVEVVRHPPNRRAPIILLIASAIFTIEMGKHGATPEFALGLLGLVVSIWWLLNQRPTYAVVLATSAGEIRALESRKSSFIDSVVVAINDAIVSHS